MISWLWYCYNLLVAGRFIQVFFFNGYRPFDDYGRSMELYMPWIIDGKSHSLLDLSISRTQLFPLLSGEFSSLLITLMRLYSKNHPSLNSVLPSISPFFVVRMLSFFASLLIDYFLFRIARRWRIKPNLVLFLYASSHIPWTYFTFGRSCLIETILFAALLAAVAASPSFENNDLQRAYSITHGSNNHGNCHNHGGHLGKHGNEEIEDDTTGAFILGLLFAFGVSNRLNFAILALAPLTQWLSASQRSGCFNFISQLFRKTCGFVIGCFWGLLIISIIDSSTTGILQIERLPNLEHLFNLNTFLYLLKNNLTFASWNSLRSELSFENVASQSIHPWYTHVIINVPLVFGVFGIYVILYFLQCFRVEILYHIHQINAKYWFLLSSFIVPLISLSIYPVKNSEDLYPLLVPLVLIVVIRISQYTYRFQTRLILAWCAWNLFGLFYFGFLYNGSLIKCISVLESVRLAKPTTNGTENRTYAYHFFATEELPSISWFSPTVDMLQQRLLPAPTLFYYRKNETSKFLRRLKNSREKYTDIYAIVPATVSLCNLWLTDELRLSLVRKHSWHYVPEAPPNLWYLLGCSAMDTGSNNMAAFGMEQRQCLNRHYQVPCMENKWNQLSELLSLKVFRVQ